MTSPGWSDEPPPEYDHGDAGAYDEHGDPERIAPGVDHDVVRRRFPRLDVAALLAPGRPPRQWVIHGLIPAGAAVALVAPAGAGKSLLALAAAIDIARGRTHFAGMRIPKQRRVLLVDLENTEDDLAERLTALGLTPDDAPELDQLVPIHLPPLAPLDSHTGALELLAILDAYDVTAGDVVILDSFQRVVKGKENDSDTYRDFYRHTGIALKRRGLTVIRTDNTGKDTDRGARGSSGKRDDVDLELVVTRDADRPDRMRIAPGKSRLLGVTPVLIQTSTTEGGRLIYSTALDPFRTLVTDAHEALDQLGLPLETGEPAALKALKDHGHKIPRTAVRQAIKERKTSPTTDVQPDPELPVQDLAEGRGEVAKHQLAKPTRRGAASDPRAETNPQVKPPIDLADSTRRASGEAQPATSPPRSLSLESGEQGECACGKPISDIRAAFGKTLCVACEAS